MERICSTRHQPKTKSVKGIMLFPLIFTAVQLAAGDVGQIRGCRTTGDNSCYDNYKFIGREGVTCELFSNSACPTADTYPEWNEDEIAQLWEACPYTCKTCRNGFPQCKNDVLFRDYKGFSCSSWNSYNCSTATDQFGYSSIQENLVIHTCPRACGACADLSDPGCVFPFTYKGQIQHGSVLINGMKKCMTRQGGLKFRIPAGTPCKFPFVYDGVRYSECTTAGTRGDYAWCPTKTKKDGTLVTGHWAVCRNCNLNRTPVRVNKCIVTDQPTMAPTEAPVVEENNGMDDNQDGMDDNEDGMNDNQDGMDDNEDGMNDNQEDNGMNDNEDGMDRRRRKRRSRFPGLPRYETCKAQWEHRHLSTTTRRSQIHRVDQLSSDQEYSFFERLSNDPAAMSLFVFGIIAIVGGLSFAAYRHRETIRAKLLGTTRNYNPVDPFDG